MGSKHYGVTSKRAVAQKTFRRDPEYSGLLVLDATGIGDPVYDDLRHVLPRIEPVKLTSVSKSQLIQRLIVAIQQRQIAWPAKWSVLTDELKRYEYKLTANGNITYNAPGGYHDDCVIALALANSARWQFKSAGTIRVLPSAPKAGRLWGSGRACASPAGTRPLSALFRITWVFGPGHPIRNQFLFCGVQKSAHQTRKRCHDIGRQI